MRDALQGVARVGRDGDPCKRIKFADFKELVDKDLQAKNNAKLLKFVANFKSKPTVKPVTASHSDKKPQPTQGLRMSQARARNLLV